MKNIIIGGGLSGLSAVYFADFDFLLFEKQSELGGLCKTYSIGDFKFDLAPHYLHVQTNQARKVLFKIFPNIPMHQRKAEIYMNEQYIPYPFQRYYHLLNNQQIVDECNQSVESTDEPLTFHDWLTNKFGKGITKYFMEPYNNKLWTVHPSEMTHSWIRHIIPDRSENGYNNMFFYPKNGIGEFTDKMINKIPSELIRLNTRIWMINIRKKAIFDGNRWIKYKNLISTMSLPDLLSAINWKNFSIQNAFQYNKVLLFNIGIRKLLNKSWIYIPSTAEYPYRIGCYSYAGMNMAPKDSSSISIECAFQSNQFLNFSIIQQQIMKLLQKMGIIDSVQDVESIDIRVLNPAYPLPTFERDYYIEKILSYLQSHDIYSIGRFGKMQYISMMETILEAKRLVEEI